MDQLQKNTCYALIAAFFLHAGVVIYLNHFHNRSLEVPFTSEQFSTRISMGEMSRPAPTVPSRPAESPAPPKKKLLTAQKSPVPSVAARPAQTQGSVQPVSRPAVDSAAVSSGSNTAEASPHQAKDEMQKYIKKVTRIIDAKKRYPTLSKANQEEGVVLLQLVLGRSGELLSFSVLDKPPYERLFQAAIDTVKAASPFPPLPASYGKERLLIQVPVRFRMSRG